jgi:hypothetical protein
MGVQKGLILGDLGGNKRISGAMGASTTARDARGVSPGWENMGCYGGKLGGTEATARLRMGIAGCKRRKSGAMGGSTAARDATGIVSGHSGKWLREGHRVY